MSNVATNVAEKKKASIEVVEHPKFEGDITSKLISGNELSDMISSMFGEVMHDLYGSSIGIVNDRVPLLVSTLGRGRLYVDLYFKDRGPADNPIKKNIVLRGNSASGGKETDLGERFARVNGANNGRLFDVTRSTYEMLEEFMLTGPRTRWVDFTQEMASPMGPYSRDEVVVKISGLDLDRIITKIYGSKTEDARYEYRAYFIRNNPNSQDFTLEIKQLNYDAIRKMERYNGTYDSIPQNFRAFR